jgi:fucose 4-O-acetylase-like acetyltransferase
VLYDRNAIEENPLLSSIKYTIMGLLMAFSLSLLIGYVLTFFSLRFRLGGLLSHTSTEETQRALKRNMSKFFVFMIALVVIRIAYHLIVVFNPLKTFFDIKSAQVFNAALIVPYSTEILFNLVIFYFNFLLPDQEDR